jgi:flavodoxin I
MAKRIGLFYGTQTGNTEMIAEAIRDQLGEDLVELHDIGSASPEDFSEYSLIIVGCPTWNIGDLQADWEAFFPELDSMDFTGKKVAYFGCGDQIGYADNFMDAAGILEEKIASRGGETVGYWSTSGYEHEESKAVRNGNQFVGLAIDEDNQSELTDDRVSAWVKQIRKEMGV